MTVQKAMTIVVILFTLAVQVAQIFPGYAAQRAVLAARRLAECCDGRRPRRPRPWTVVYDGLCPLCLRTTVTLDFLDLRRRLAYLNLEADWERVTALAPGLTPEEARAAMVVLSPDGVRYSGRGAAL